MYMSSLGNIAICIPTDPHNYKRSKNGWTISKIYYVVEFIPNMGSVECFVKTSYKNLASNFTQDSYCWANFAGWFKVHKPRVYHRETGIDNQKKKIS